MTKPRLLYYSALLTGIFTFFSAPIFGQNTDCVGDTIAPFFERCPQNMVINQSTNAGTNPNCAFVQWDAPLAYDNCGVASMTRTWTSGACFPLGSTTVTFTAMDSSQNRAVCSFTITVLPPTVESCVHDSISPILSRCPENIFLNTNDTCAVAQWVEPIATDNCSTPIVIGTFESGMCFPLGNTSVAYTATDSVGNSSSCSFVVIVINPCATDTIKPVFATCPNNIVLSTSGTTCASAQWTAPRASDNCGIASTFSTAQPGRCFNIGITTVTYRATDLKGNTGICTFTVNVSSPCAVDTIRPVISACPTNIVIGTYDTCAVATWVAPTATDNCSIAAIFPTVQSGTCFPLGTTIVSYLARDAKNNTSGCEFTVTVNHLCAGDTIKPSFTKCPTNIVLSTTDSCAFAQWAVPTAVDNCATPTLTSTHNPGTCFNLGLTNVTYTATDTRNNKATCSFLVTVANNSPCANDTQKPTLSNCPSNITLVTSTTCAVARWAAPRITDNCGTPTLTSTRQSGECFNVGDTDVVYTGKDTKNNTVTCTFRVRVLYFNPCATDSIKPLLLNCPSNIVLTTTDTCAFAQWSAPTAFDFCGTPTITSTHTPSRCFRVGTTTVTYTATDANNNKSQCAFTVTVTNPTSPCATDTVKPVFEKCPVNIVLTTLDTCAFAQWVAPIATDNCGTPSVVSTHNSGTCFPIGTRTVGYAATDAKSNRTYCTFTVTVNQIITTACQIDTVKPKITCYNNLDMTTTDTCLVVNWGVPTATDNCGTPILTSNYQNGTCFKAGTTTTIIYTATDTKGNQASCSFFVKITRCVNDTIKPILTRCPANIALVSIDSCTLATWTPPTATDNCSSPIIHATKFPNTCFVFGTTTVTYTASDVSRNISTCSFTVTVTRPCANDTIKPRFPFCPTNIVLTSSDSCAKTTWVMPVATDNCSEASVTGTHNPNFCFKTGVTNVVYTAKDANNNTGICAFTVTVTNPCATDTTKPRIANCPANIVLNTTDSCAIAQWVAPTVTDNCGTPTLTTSHQAGRCFNVGTTPVTFTAKDTKGNTTLCTFTVTVNNPCLRDSIKPIIANCPANIAINTADSCAIAQWVAPTATDNCGIPTLIATHQSGMCFNVGTTTVTYTVRDAKGNTSLCTFAVTVNNPCFRDSIKPVIANCPANITVNTADSCAIARWTAPTATDNCGVPTLTASHQSGACFKVGTTTVSYNAKDAKNNTAVCSFRIVVNNPCFVDSIKPVIRSCPANISLSSADSCSIARWVAPTATDNCGTPTLTASHQSGLCFRVGSTTVTYTARDAKNNTATCTFKVTVSNPCFTDTIKPTIYNCPVNIVKTIADTAVQITWKAPTALDNCGAATLTTTKQPNSLFGIGATPVVYTASDSKNNRRTCTFTVTINRTITPCSNDTVRPVFTSCPTNITVTTTSPNAIAQWTPPTATDNCSTPSVTSTFATGASFPTGTTAVVYTAKDAKGNTRLCNFTVTVITNRVSLVLDSTKCYALIARSSKKAISIANASTTAGAYGVQWAYLNSLNQKWKIAAADSNSFNFTNRQSNLNLDTRWGSLANNERLTQWGKSATATTQKWQLTLLADGYYRVTNKGSGRALSVSGGATATANGALLIQSTYTGLTSQQWSISEVPCTSTTAAFATNDVIEMQANPEFNRARIEWTDNTGYKNDYYEIQKLNQTSGEFERLDVVNNKSVSDAPSYQTYYDNAPMDGDNFYRVKVVYLDSVSKLSAVKKLVFNGLETVKLFPNPANDYVDIDLAKFGNEAINIYLYNSFGKQVAFRSVQKDKFSVVHFDISQQEMGNYLMRISAQGKKDVIRQLQIVR